MLFCKQFLDLATGENDGMLEPQAPLAVPALTYCFWGGVDTFQKPAASLISSMI